VLRPQPWAVKLQLHYLSAPHCAAPVTFGSELPLLILSLLPRTLTRLNVVRCAIIYIIRCDEFGCPDDGMLVVGGSCLLSIGAMVVVGIPMRKTDNRKVDDSALWRTPNPG